MGDPYGTGNQLPPPANQVPPPAPGGYYPPNNPFPAPYHGAPPPPGGHCYAYAGVHYPNAGYAAPGGQFQAAATAANPPVPPYNAGGLHGNLQGAANLGGAPRAAQTAGNFFPAPRAANVHMGPRGGQGGPRPPAAGQEYARVLLAKYRNLGERRNELTAERQEILNQREQLTAQISNPNNAEGQMEFGQQLEEMERLGQRLAYLAPTITHMDTVYHSIPNLLKSESVIPVNSVQDIHIARNLRMHFGWTGLVNLIEGGPDPWDTCLAEIVDGGLPMLL